jgi:hypothetical protein
VNRNVTLNVTFDKCFEPEPLPSRRAKRRCIPEMTATIESPAENRAVSPSTLRARRHRERRRERLRLFTVEAPEDLIDEALARDLLKPEGRADWWAVIQACYAAQLSDVALDRLTNGGVITREQRGDAVAILDSISNWLEHAD